MRSLPYAVPFVLMLVACGGGGSTSNPTPDAPNNVVHDAPGSNPTGDAPTTAEAMGLGKQCGDATHTCPTTGATLCAKVGTGALGFCTLSCGSTPTPAAGTQPTPPAGGDAICTGSMPAPGAGTPACALTGAPMNGQTPWACGILCGTSGTMNLGGCPGGLTCTANFCQ